MKPLSPRELQVLSCAARGDTIERTGNVLGCGLKTVKCHREHIKTKLGAVNFYNAVAIAVSKGLVEIAA